MIKPKLFTKLLQWATFGSLGVMASTGFAVTIPNTPLVTQVSAKPMVMLVASKDHKLFFEAYNDASDLDGDGNLDIRFKPSIKYYGLFDYDTCYTYASNLFTPSVAAGANGSCSGKWSGRWLNYVTTSRVDALRKVLYGGHREVDSTTQTVLRRAYIPQDGHSWAKEYTSITNDGYKISDYTPLSEPTGSNRHFFGNLTRNAGTNCSTLDNCSNLAPVLAVVTNSTKRVWEWASKENPVLDGTHGGSLTDYSVRVVVCTSVSTKDCKKYPNGAYKPVGLLHDYGANGAMLFGLLTGSYNKNMSGGVLRKVASKFIDDDNPSDGEVNPSTGIFTSNATIVKSMNNLRIRDHNNGNTNPAYRNGSFRTGPMNEGAYVDWGNPVGEMMYEALRYFAGKSSPTSAFSTSGGHDAAVGLSAATWDNPYASTSKAKAPWCARANMLVMSDVYTSYDADQVPGSPFSSMSTDISGFDVGGLLTTISNSEDGVKGSRFVGQSTLTNGDFAPTPKPVTSLSTVRGLAPEEATKQGSYTAAGVAYYGQINDINTTVSGIQKLDSYFIALSSTLPKIEIPSVVNGVSKTIQIIPFAKTTDGASTNPLKGQYQAADQIVDLYVEKDDLKGPTKEMIFRINFEADEQGNDFDMDAVAMYTVKDLGNGQVSVSVEVISSSTGSLQNIGYVISGTDRDGIYLVTQDKDRSVNYFLNVPPGKSKGYCDVSPFPAGCNKLPYAASNGAPAGFRVSTQTFSAASTTSTDQFLKDPLWYAAKWGKFNDLNGSRRPDLDDEWDLKRNTVPLGDPIEKGVPDNYFQVQNPLRLKDALKVAFDGIADVDSSASNVISNSANTTNTESQDLVFQARFASKFWAGTMTAYPISSAGVSSVFSWQSTTPAPASRKIFANTSTGATEFLWANLSADDKTSLDDDSNVLDYLRGVRSKEVEVAKAAGTTGSFRDRAPSTVIGDIVHSSPFYAVDGSVETIYVGANDGMLHAFNAKTGVEIFGFIPRESMSRLKNLASPAYVHDYYVDGDVVVSPKTSTGKIWLYSLLGRGGKGLFSLNVTDPQSVNASKFLWEYSPSASSVAAADKDLGYMLGQPLYAKMNNGMDALIVGNGYNSTDGRAVLYIFLIDSNGGYTLKKLVTDTPQYGDNGLSAPGAFDAGTKDASTLVFDGGTDGKIDFIYAGDLQGNVWKFDVSDTNPANWKVDLGGANGTPFFVAKNSSNQLQPIVAPISVGVNTVLGSTHYGKRYIFFGTGAYFRSSDPTDTNTQTWYGLIDEGATITSRTDLKSRTITAGTFTIDDGNPATTDVVVNVRTFPTAAANDMVGKKGWYVDLAITSKERIVTESVLMKLAVPTLLASSIIPVTNDPCTPGGNGYLNAIDPFTGGATKLGILDVNKNKNYSDDKLSGVLIGSIDLGIGMPSRPSKVRGVVAVGGTSAEIGKRIGSISVNLGVTPMKGRISWREILKD